MTVVEVQDPRASLVVPAGPAEDFAESLRWQAGPLLGGLDWLLEKLIHRSAIVELVEPLSGDWVGLEKGAQAWRHAGAASDAIAANYAAAGQDALRSWSGDAADAFGARAADVAESFAEYGEGCRAMGEVTAALLDLAKATAEALAGILGWFGDYLTRALIEVSIPIAGWIAGAVDGAISAGLLIGKLERGYRLLQRVLDAIEQFRDVIVALQRIAYTIALLAKATTSVVDVQTVGAGASATSTAFGVAR